MEVMTEKPLDDFLENISVNSDSIIDKNSHFEGLEEYVDKEFDKSFEINSNFSDENLEDNP